MGDASLTSSFSGARELYKLVKIGGGDAALFLQGQLTQDLARLRNNACLPAAWCNPTARVIATLRLLSSGDGFGLIVSTSIAETFVSRLGMYRLRADLSMEIAGPEWTAAAIDNEADRRALAECDLLPDAAMNACKSRAGLHAVATGGAYTAVEIFGEKDAFATVGLTLAEPMSDTQWQAARIRAGSADIMFENSELFTPHMLNLDLTGAVSFDKGCYTGQEIVARTQNLGRSRRRLMRFVASHAGAAIGDQLWRGDRVVGDVVNAAGHDLLVVGPIGERDQPFKLSGEPVAAGDMPYPLPSSP